RLFSNPVGVLTEKKFPTKLEALLKSVWYSLTDVCGVKKGIVKNPSSGSVAVLPDASVTEIEYSNTSPAENSSTGKLKEIKFPELTSVAVKVPVISLEFTRKDITT